MLAAAAAAAATTGTGSTPFAATATTGPSPPPSVAELERQYYNLAGKGALPPAGHQRHKRTWIQAISQLEEDRSKRDCVVDKSWARGGLGLVSSTDIMSRSSPIGIQDIA
jgi:hypothetical protein